MSDDNEIINPSGNQHFAEILQSHVSRRKVLSGSLAVGLGMFLPGLAGAEKITTATNNRQFRNPLRSRLIDFEAVTIENGGGQMPAISEHYQYQVIIPWGTPLEPQGPLTKIPPQSADDQASQVGIGHDGMVFFPFPDERETRRENRHGLLAINHEFGRNSHVLGKNTPENLDEVRISQHAHGVSIIELQENASHWSTVNSRYARRIHANTPVIFSGPAAESDLLKTVQANRPKGTVNNCSGGATPWGTYLTCEENFNGYFAAGSGNWQSSAQQKRYGFTANGFGYGWEKFDRRFDLSAPEFKNEENRFGWVMEIDPFDAAARPVKRTALGRFKHEGAATVVGKHGRVVIYMGDDQAGEYIYRFVSSLPYKKALKKGLSPLDDGILYVARFNADGSGEWLALSIDNPILSKHFQNQAEILIYTRMAADLVGATPMDRPEWTAVAPDGQVYCTLTNNRQRGDNGKFQFDAANPGETEEFDQNGRSKGNASGHIIRWQDSDNHTGTSFKWEIFLIAKNTQGSEDVFSAPDGLYADPDGRLFIETDGGQKNGLNNQLLVADTLTKEVRRLFTGVPGDEITGITMTPDRRTLFINCQHPGKGNPKISNFPAPPDGKTIPRDCTLVITRKDGGIIGS